MALSFLSQNLRLILLHRFIASAGTYANLVRQAKSKQKIIDKMEAAGLIEKVEAPRPLRYAVNLAYIEPPSSHVFVKVQL